MTDGSPTRSFGSPPQSWAHQSDLVMYARRVLGDRDGAEDIVQEAYLRLLALAASDEAPTSARPWLFRVVRNLAIDERRGSARRATPVAEIGEYGLTFADDTADVVERKEELAGALAGVAALPARERQAVEMDQAGIGAQQIAEELHTTPNAVHQALFRARRRLRESKAVAWGLIPVGIIPLVLRLSDPALAVSVTNLPPGLPVGRALPVAGLVAAAMVSGSVVAPSVDPSPPAKPFQTFAKSAPAATGTPTSNVGNRGPSAKTGTSSDDRSGRSGSDDASKDRSGRRGGGDASKEDRSGRRGGDDRSDDDDSGRRSGDNTSGDRKSGSGPGRRGSDRSSDDNSGRRSGGGDDAPKANDSRDSDDNDSSDD